jgi:hypothetical protein
VLPTMVQMCSCAVLKLTGYREGRDLTHSLETALASVCPTELQFYSVSGLPTKSEVKEEVVTRTMMRVSAKHALKTAAITALFHSYSAEVVFTSLCGLSESVPLNTLYSSIRTALTVYTGDHCLVCEPVDKIRGRCVTEVTPSKNGGSSNRVTQIGRHLAAFYVTYRLFKGIPVAIDALLPAGEEKAGTYCVEFAPGNVNLLRDAYDAAMEFVARPAISHRHSSLPRAAFVCPGVEPHPFVVRSGGLEINVTLATQSTTWEMKLATEGCREEHCSGHRAHFDSSFDPGTLLNLFVHVWQRIGDAPESRILDVTLVDTPVGT